MANQSPLPRPADREKAAPKSGSLHWLISQVSSLGFAILVVLAIRSSFVEPFKIPSGSMIPTLLTGDHIFVNKLAYGLKVPFTDWFASTPKYITGPQTPERGDIVVFLFPKDTSLHYIKRVIGVPGDQIEVKNKVIFINGQEIKKDTMPADRAKDILAKMKEPKYEQPSLELYTEHLLKVEHTVMLDRENYMTGENFGPVTVPADHLFVMGDNRDFSNDSRFWGFVPMKYVKGKAFVIWLSLWLEFPSGSWVPELTWRSERIGTILH
jgi:signal peptidase I